MIVIDSTTSCLGVVILSIYSLFLFFLSVFDAVISSCLLPDNRFQLSPFGQSVLVVLFQTTCSSCSLPDNYSSYSFLRTLS